MPFDVVAWYEDGAFAALGNITAALKDDIYKVETDDITVKKRAAFLAGLIVVSNDDKTLKYGEIRQPSLKIPYRSYMTGSYETAGAAGIAGAMLNLFASPLPLYAGEKMNAAIFNSSTEPQLIVALLSSGRATKSAMENVNPTHLVTGHSTTTLVAGSWVKVPVTWDQSLPKGRYAVVGMRVGSWITGQTIGMGFARLTLLDSTWRPGVANSWMWGQKLAAWMGGAGFDTGHRWPLMREISFEHDEMPNMEILGVEYLLTQHVINLLLQKIQ